MNRFWLAVLAVLVLLATACGGSGGDGGGDGNGANGDGGGGGTSQQPAAPTKLRLFLKTYNTIELRWNDNSNNEQGFKVYQVGKSEAVASANANTSRAVVEGLQCGTDYQFEVRAFNSAGESYSDLLDATTKLCDVQVAFTTVCVLNDEDPVGAGELWFWFKSARSAGERVPSSGTKSIESREFSINLDILNDPFSFGEISYIDNPQCFDPQVGFSAAMRYDEPLEVYVDGWDEDDVDPDDSLGSVSEVYENGAEWTSEGHRSGHWYTNAEGKEVWYDPVKEGFPGAGESSNGDFTVWWVVKVTGFR